MSNTAMTVRGREKLCKAHAGEITLPRIKWIAFGTGGVDENRQPLSVTGEEVELKEEMTAPIKEGTVVGSVQYFLGEELIRSYPIVTEEGAERIDFRWCLKKILKDFGIGKI